MHTVIQSGFGAWLIIGCVLFVILLAFAGKVYHKMKYENHKHHFIVFNDNSVDSIYGYEDDDDDNDIFSGATTYSIDNPNPEPLPGATMPAPQPDMIECVRFVANPARRDDIGNNMGVA